MNTIHESFKHGRNFRIGEFCHIHEDVEVGDDVTIRSFVELRPRTVVGSRVYVDSGVKTSGDCRIGDDVTLRYDCIIARGVEVGDGTFIAPQLMTENLDEVRASIGGAKIGRGVFIGTNVTLASGITICDGAVIGSKANVRKSIAEKGVYVGNPARRLE